MVSYLCLRYHSFLRTSQSHDPTTNCLRPASRHSSPPHIAFALPSDTPALHSSLHRPQTMHVFVSLINAVLIPGFIRRRNKYTCPSPANVGAAQMADSCDTENPLASRPHAYVSPNHSPNEAYDAWQSARASPLSPGRT
jgi:hypothetical protein